jgi:hypothetical protein
VIHFTRRRNADIQAAPRIEGFDEKPVESLRVRGVWPWTGNSHAGGCPQGGGPVRSVGSDGGLYLGPQLQQIAPPLRSGGSTDDSLRVQDLGSKEARREGHLLRPLVKLQNNRILNEPRHNETRYKILIGLYLGRHSNLLIRDGGTVTLAMLGHRANIWKLALACH